MDKSEAAAVMPSKLALGRWTAAARADINLTTGLSLSSALFTIGFAWSLSVGVSQSLRGEQSLDWLLWGAIALLGRTLALWLSERAAARAGNRIVEACISGALEHANSLTINNLFGGEQ
jgi:ABC-type transport system involved in cytochrome bd biosynthesis fused ATPase/permease subunit